MSVGRQADGHRSILFVFLTFFIFIFLFVLVIPLVLFVILFRFATQVVQDLVHKSLHVTYRFFARDPFLQILFHVPLNG